MSPKLLHLAPDFFGDFEVERSVLSEYFDDVRIHGHSGEVDELLSSPIEADILVTFGTPVGQELLEATSVSVVAVYATGVDCVDVSAATELGVAVTRVPEYCDREVGEHVISMALALVRGLPQYDATTARGEWDWNVANPLRTFTEQTVGLLAFGRKARAVADLAGRLGFDVVAYDPYVDDEEMVAHDVTPGSLETVLERADVLSVHLPLTPETEGLLGRESFGSMKEGAVLINTGRGAVIDESALCWALDEGPLDGAGLDVLSSEPPSPDNLLLGRDDTIVTPHVAWNSEGAIRRLRTRGTEYAAAAFQGRSTEALVNPDVLDSSE